MLTAWCLLPLAGAFAAWLLFRQSSIAPSAHAPDPTDSDVSIIIPARNEQANLPTLLTSILRSDPQPRELLVVDDHSTDATARIAREHGATVLASAPLAPGWTGKTWACVQGVASAHSDLLLFLDADTWFEPGGLQQMLALYRSAAGPAALSILPYHVTQRPYEQLSLFFNLLMAAGAGGFSGLADPALFGQSLLLPRPLYIASGGHAAVRSHVLENLHLAPVVRAAGGRTLALPGRGILSMRMFPEGPAQLIAGWRKGFASGASATPRATILLTSVWIAALILAAVNLLLTAFLRDRITLAAACAVYILLAAQGFALARRFGTFRWWSAALYPCFLGFYLAVFAQSVALRRRGGGLWKGRRV
jgi:4,4'-diaponeurosporenoate glycosyltransferase